mmetsp:Transcript_42597/g.85278  ORF Transcript_42597/g.85278 Transcript_42597/m.85278 type:complete len:211 (+) Transcript_42597:36-668(+)
MIRTALALAFIASANAFAGLSLLPALRRGAKGVTAHPMSMKIGVFYGTSTGNTESVAERIATALGVTAEDIGSVEASALSSYDTLVVGAPTWHTGADTERSGTDWDEILYNDVPNMDLKGKKVAFFGCGDSMSYGDYFCDAMGELYDKFAESGVETIGFFDVDKTPECVASKAIRDGKFVGLACDEDNFYDETDKRIAAWTEQLKSEGAA